MKNTLYVTTVLSLAILLHCNTHSTEPVLDKDKLLSQQWPASTDTMASERKHKATELLNEAKGQINSERVRAEKLLFESLRQYPIAETYYELGNLLFSKAPEDAVKAYSRSAEMSRSFEARSLYNIACIRSLLGQFYLSNEYLRKAARAGYKNWQHALSDPDLQALRQNKWRSFWANINLMRLGQNTFQEQEDFVGFIGVNDAAGTPTYHLFCPDGRYFTDACFLTARIDRGRWWLEENALFMKSIGECEPCQDREATEATRRMSNACSDPRQRELISSRCMKNLNIHWNAETYGDELLPILRCGGDLEVTPFRGSVPEICSPDLADIGPEKRWKLLQKAYDEYQGYGL